jgi:hypothetical protein
MNEQTEQMLDKLARRHGLRVHVKPGGDKGGLRGPKRGTLWVNWLPRKREWNVKPQGESWAGLVRSYLRSVEGNPAYFSGVDGWKPTSPEVVEEAVRIMAWTQHNT